MTRDPVATSTDNDEVVRFDIKAHPELTRATCTGGINGVQKLRKKTGLRTTGDVETIHIVPIDKKGGKEVVGL